MDDGDEQDGQHHADGDVADAVQVQGCGDGEQGGNCGEGAEEGEEAGALHDGGCGEVVLVEGAFGICCRSRVDGGVLGRCGGGCSSFLAEDDLEGVLGADEDETANDLEDEAGEAG